MNISLFPHLGIAAAEIDHFPQQAGKVDSIAYRAPGAEAVDGYWK